MSLNQNHVFGAIYSQQNNFLAQLMTNQQPIHIFLLNGIRLKGYIVHFDNHVIFLANQPLSINNAQMVYKRNIATVLRASWDSKEA